MKRKSMMMLVLLCALPMLFANGTGEAGSKKGIELSAATGGMSANSPAGRAMAKFADKVQEYSQGSVDIKVFYDTTLGNASSMINGFQQGTVDIGVCGDSYYSGLVPEIQAFELPYVFDSLKDARTAVAGKAGDYIKDKLQQKGIHPLTFWEIGFRELTNNKRPVTVPADLKGIKLRCLPASFQVKAWEAAGAIPVPMDVSELYSSLQQGVVDGQENPLSEIYNQRFYEVQKYLSLTDHVYTPMLFSISNIAWNKLDASQQDALVKAAKDAQSEVYRINDEESTILLKKIEDAGVKVEQHPDKAAFKVAMAQSLVLFKNEYGDTMFTLMGK
ncbi:MAG: DctP family TRAP transporter solute-binding subunit [Spirochaetia bacterium]|jgi:tripartite ATP-independent transporter DctP family solute receptor|nr:DctP family TRAP transporter solute-binding subunit [Spirochaetia bacterium]